MGIKFKAVAKKLKSLIVGVSGEVAEVNIDNELQIRDDDANASLSSIDSKLVDGTDIGDVTVNNAAGSDAVNIQDGGNSITVDSENLDIRDLDEATDSVNVVNQDLAEFLYDFKCVMNDMNKTLVRIEQQLEFITDEEMD